MSITFVRCLGVDPEVTTSAGQQALIATHTHGVIRSTRGGEAGAVFQRGWVLVAVHEGPSAILFEDI